MKFLSITFFISVFTLSIFAQSKDYVSLRGYSDKKNLSYEQEAIVDDESTCIGCYKNRHHKDMKLMAETESHMKQITGRGYIKDNSSKTND